MNTAQSLGKTITSFVAGILGLAIVAVILSNGSNTVNVLKTFFNGLTSLVQVTVSPVTGGSNAALSSLSNTSGITNGTQNTNLVSPSQSQANPVNNILQGLGNNVSGDLGSFGLSTLGNLV